MLLLLLAVSFWEISDILLVEMVSEDCDELGDEHDVAEFVHVVDLESLKKTRHAAGDEAKRMEIGLALVFHFGEKSQRVGDLGEGHSADESVEEVDDATEKRKEVVNLAKLGWNRLVKNVLGNQRLMSM